jgi:type IV pilus assembly protein PilP
MTTRRFRSSFWALAATASLGTALGCSEEPPSSGLKANEFAEARAAAVQGTKPAPPPPAVTPVAPQPAINPISGVAQIDTGYTYDPTGKRDPFRSFIWDRPDKMQANADAGPLGQFDLSQLEVVGVVWRTGNARALVEDPSGESYIVGHGAAIGKNRGHVISIDDNTVIVKEIYVDYLGQETTKDVEMRMRRNEGG